MVIADDEILTLDLLQNIIDWDTLGIEIIGKAQNGLEVISIIEKDCPDILITDIRMPEMDGLGLIKNIRNKNKNMKIIILSAYGEFEYAQKALSYDVAGYLLKPVDEDKMEELIKKVINEIEEEQEIKNTFSRVIGLDKYKSELGENRGDSNSLIKESKDYIKQNYNKDIALEDICSHIGISKNYFCNLFKREVGEGIWDYLTRIRIEKAKELLMKTDLRCYEVSYEIGYENPSHFTKMFKKFTGLTPNEYREKKDIL